MPNSNAIRAGAAYVEVYGDNSELKKDLEESEAGLSSFGVAVASIGAAASNSWTALAAAFQRSTAATITGAATVTSAVVNTVKSIGEGVTASGEQLKSWGSTIASVGAKVAAIGGIVKGVFAAALHTFEETGTAAQLLSNRTGVTTEAMSTLSFAARDCGANADSLEGAFAGLTKTLSGQTPAAIEGQRALAILGLTAKDLKAMSPDQQFRLIADRLSRVPDPAQRAAGALKIFGASAEGLAPLLAMGAAGLQLLEDRARSLGIEMKGEDAKSALALHNAFATLWETVKMATFAIGAPLADALRGLVDTGTAVVGTISKWIRENGALIVSANTIASIVTGAGTALTVFGGIVSGAGVVLTELVAVVGALLSPLALATAAVAGLGYYLVTSTAKGQAALGWLSAKFFELREDAVGAFGAIAEALAAGDISTAVEIAGALLKLEWSKALAYLTEKWNAFQTFVVSISSDIATAAVATWEKISASAADAWDKVKSGVTDVTEFFKDKWAGVRDFMRETIAAISEYLDRVAETAKKIASFGGTVLANAAPATAATLTAIGSAGGSLSGIGDTINDWGDSLTGTEKGPKAQAARRAREAATGAEEEKPGPNLWDQMKSTLGLGDAGIHPKSLIGQIGSKALNAADAIKGLFGRAFDAAGNAAGEKPDDVATAQQALDDAKAKANRPPGTPGEKGKSIAADFSIAAKASEAAKSSPAFEDVRTAGGFKSLADSFRQSQANPMKRTEDLLEQIRRSNSNTERFSKDTRDAIVKEEGFKFR